MISWRLCINQHCRTHRATVDKVKHRFWVGALPDEFEPLHQRVREALREKRALALVRVGEPHQRWCWRHGNSRTAMGRDGSADDAEQFVVSCPLSEAKDATRPQHPEGLGNCLVWMLHVHQTEGARYRVKTGIRVR